MGSSCCAKDKNAKNGEDNLHLDQANKENPIDDHASKPKPIVKPLDSELDNIFLQKAALIRSSVPEVSVFLLFINKYRMC